VNDVHERYEISTLEKGVKEEHILPQSGNVRTPVLRVAWLPCWLAGEKDQYISAWKEDS